MTDTITLPRETVQQVLKPLTEIADLTEDTGFTLWPVQTAIKLLEAALAQPPVKQERVFDWKCPVCDKTAAERAAIAKQEPVDYCTDPDNCRRCCKTHPKLRGDMEHAGIGKRPQGEREWFNEKNDIVIGTLPELVAVANTPQFGESERETLPTFLMCQAFECRGDPEMARTFRLAAMIISRLPDSAAISGAKHPTD